MTSKLLSFENKNKVYFVFHSLIRNIELRSKVLAFGKIKFYLLFHSLIRTFAPDFMNMWIDLGCLQPQKKMLKEKTCLANGTQDFHAFRPISFPIHY